MPSDNTCWVVSDGRAGNERQALALAHGLGFDTRVMRMKLREPWQGLAPRLTLGVRHAIVAEGGVRFEPPWPEVAIGAGRRAALVTRMLRRWSKGDAYTIQILDPRIDPRAFDIVVAPLHDNLAGANVVQTIGALNPVDADWLADGRRRFAALAALPEPRTTVLIGASNRAQRLDEPYFDGLVERLRRRHASDGGSFLVSASRRTPANIVARLRDAFRVLPGVFHAPGDTGENPYPGLLGWAQRFVVTPDSVNMISECCATERPVYTFAPRPIGGKLASFHARLRASGALRDLDDPRPAPPRTPLAETSAVAEIVRERWATERRHLVDS